MHYSVVYSHLDKILGRLWQLFWVSEYLGVLWYMLLCSCCLHLSRLKRKPIKWVYAQRRLRSGWASAQSDQPSLSAWRNTGSLATHWVHSKDSDQLDSCPGWSDPADQSLRWVHTHFVGFVMAWLISYSLLFVQWVSPQRSTVPAERGEKERRRWW